MKEKMMPQRNRGRKKEGMVKGHKTVATNLITDISTLKYRWPITLWKKCYSINQVSQSYSFYSKLKRIPM